MSRNKSIMSFIDLTGQRFGRAIALERDYGFKGQAYWRCVCDCGKFFSTASHSLRVGDCKSCGCLNSEKARERSTKHGMKHTKAYRAWKHLKARCYNEKVKEFHNYGGRGIKVCDRWLESFENFIADMGHPQPHESIDRINNDGDYCPENCRWTDSKTQSRNTRRNRFITLNGESKTIAEWSEITGIEESAITKRLKLGWSDHDALTKPVSNSGKLHFLEFNGESKTISEWSRITNISKGTINRRLREGWSNHDALTEPARNKGHKRYLDFNGESKTISAWAKATNISKETIRFRLKRGWSIEKTLTTPPDQKYGKPS